MIGRLFLGRYEVVSALGQGGMGRIFLARHRTTQRTFVLKVMHEHVARQPQFRELFQREMQCMTRFTHPYAVSLYDASLTDPNGPCIVMEYVRGADFQRLLQKHRRFSLQRIGRLIGQLCEVLHAAHDQGIIHRDLKPANLMVTDWDQPLERLKVMDFGLAHVVQSNDRPKQGSGLIQMILTGTPEYISPEQAAGRKVDGRADLYSVGIVLYELLSGSRPFERASPTAYALAHINEAPPPMPASLVTPAVERVVMSCLAKSPDNRPNSALELAALLSDALGQPILDPKGSVAPPSSAVATMSGTALRNTMMQGRATKVGAAPTTRSTHVDSRAPAKSAANGTPEYPEYQFEAAMLLPETLDKLNRFALRLGGKVISLNTDQIRVLLSKDCRLPASDSSNGFLPLLTEMEIEVARKDPKLPGLHVVTMRLSPVGGGSTSVSPLWRSCCERIRAELQTSLTAAPAPAARR